MTRENAIYRSRPSPTAAGRRHRTAGFTLIELAVALTVILMIVTMVVPTMSKMLSSRASMEAFNLVAAQLSAARAEAVTSNTYAGIHVQLGFHDDMKETSYSMIIHVPQNQVDDANPKFTRPDIFMPQELPGGTALGQLTSKYVTSGDPGRYRVSSDSDLKNFCAFSLIFSPDGMVVTEVQGKNIRFDTAHAMFSGNEKTKLWDPGIADDKPGVTAFTMFDYREVWKREPADRSDYLDKHGQFLPVNMHTGQLFDRQ